VNHNKIITTQVIEDVVNNSSADRILIRDLIESMHASGFGLTMMIFALGALMPLPPPIPSIISLPLLIFSFQMISGYSSPKLPKRLASLSIKRSILASIVQKSSPYLRKIERILRPRLIFITTNAAERVIGILTLIFSISIALPLPFSNFIPALGILIISFGMMGKDGVVVMCGIVIGTIGVIISSIVIMLGVEVIHYIKTVFSNIF
jgi:hypothetical protein